MRVLLLDKNLVDKVNYKKWNLLSAKEGIQLRAITPTRWIENFRILNPEDRSCADFRIVPLKVFWSGKENRAFYLKGLSRELRSFEPDVIICFEEPFSLFALQVALLAKIHSRKSKLVFYTWDNRAKGRDFGYRPSFLYAVIQRFIVKRASVILTANEEGRAFFESVCPGRVRKLYFGMDLGIKGESIKGAVPGKMRSSPADFLIGYVGRLLEMKGIDTLIEAVAMLAPDAKLVILGSGPDEKKFKELADRIKVADRVTFLSAVSSAEARAILNELDVLVLPSRTTPIWKEQYGRVLIEAMALGTPVIGSDSGAIPEVVGEAGLIFHEGDVEELAAALKRIMSEPGLRESLSAEGIRRTPQFSAEHFAEVLHSILTDLDG